MRVLEDLENITGKLGIDGKWMSYLTTVQLQVSDESEGMQDKNIESVYRLWDVRAMVSRLMATAGAAQPSGRGPPKGNQSGNLMQITPDVGLSLVLNAVAAVGSLSNAAQQGSDIECVCATCISGAVVQSLRKLSNFHYRKMLLGEGTSDDEARAAITWVTTTIHAGGPDLDYLNRKLEREREKEGHRFLPYFSGFDVLLGLSVYNHALFGGDRLTD